MKKLLLCITFFGVANSSEYFFESSGERPPFYFSADYLLWKATLDQLQFALNIPGGLTGEGFLSANQMFIEDQHFSAHSGVRATAGYIFGEDYDWDGRVSWTHFKNGTITFVQEPESILANNLFGFLDIDALFVDSARSTWCLKFDNFDIELARNWFPIDKIALRAHAGVKVARIDQSQVIDYEGLLEGLERLGVLNINRFTGTGPCIGINMKWFLGRSFNIVTDIDASILFGQFNLSSQNFVSLVTNDGTGDMISNFDPEILLCKRRSVPALRMLLGLNWERNVNDSVDIEVMLAYEAQYWWNQWQNIGGLFGNVLGRLITGNLGIQGLTLRFGVRL